MRNQEEIESAVNYFTLLNEISVYVSALRRVLDGFSAHLKEPLAYTLVYDNKRDEWFFICNVPFFHQLVELFKLVLNYLRAHGISNAVSVHENVVWEATVIFAVRLERFCEVALQN